MTQNPLFCSDTLSVIFSFLPLRDLIRVSVVHSLFARQVDRSLKLIPIDSLLFNSYEFVSWKNVNRAIYYIVTKIRTVKNYPIFSICSKHKDTLCVRITSDGLIFMLPVIFANTLSDEEWICIGSVTDAHISNPNENTVVRLMETTGS